MMAQASKSASASFVTGRAESLALECSKALNSVRREEEEGCSAWAGLNEQLRLSEARARLVITEEWGGKLVIVCFV